MSESLRDRVEQSVIDTLSECHLPAHGDPVKLAAIGRRVTNSVFEVLSGARPCVTCGKSIGPNKVARGYVQCYKCVREGKVPAAPA